MEIERIATSPKLPRSAEYDLANAAAFAEVEHVVCPDSALHVDPERDVLWMLKRDGR